MSVTRDISTRLIMQGEKEYRAAIGEINREYKALDSQMKLVDSQFKGQQNSLAALEAKHKALSDVLAKQADKLKAENDALSKARDWQAKYAEQAEAARQKLTELTAATDAAGQETQKYKDAVAQLQSEIAKNEAAEGKCAQAVDNHTTKANQAQAKLNDLNGELVKNDKYLDEAKSSADGCAKSIDAYGKEVKQAAENSGELGSRGKAGIDALAGALSAAGITATVKEIADALYSCIDASVAFESAMAGVAKTTDMSDEELAAMSESFKELAVQIPVSAGELANITEIAGQLGVSKDNLLAFSEVMAKLGVATNMTSEEAATMLARFANVTGMSLKDVDKLGSAIVALGNNFATDEKAIAAMSQRLASAGTLAGLTEPDILALATAMSSVGIEADAGGTAMTQTLTNMGNAAEEGGDALDTFAKAAGVSSEEFAAAWQDSPIAAIQLFIGGLNTMAENGQSVNGMLGELGLSGIRQGNMLRSLALASDKLNSAVTLSNNAWQANNALNKEAATRFATTESKTKMYQNSVDNLRIAIGDQLTPALGALADTGCDINGWLEDFIQQNEWVVPAVTGVVVALGVLTAAVVGVTVVIPALKTAWTALQATMGPIGWISLAAGALAAFVVTLTDSKNELDEMTKAAQALPDKLTEADATHDQDVTDIEATGAKAQALIDRLKELEESGLVIKGTDEWREWNAILAVLVDTVPELSSVINLQTGEIEGGTDALIKNTEEWKRNAIEQAKQKALQSKYDAYGAVIAEQTENMLKLSVATQKEESARAKLRNEMLVYGRAVGMSDEQILSYGDDFSRLSDAIGAMGGDSGAAYGAMFDLADSLEDAGLVVEAYQGVLDKSNEAVETANKEIDNLSSAYNDLAGSTGGAGDKQDELTEAQKTAVEQAQQLTKESDELMKAYEESYKSALQSVSGLVDGFDAPKKLAADQRKSMKDLMDGKDSQIAYLETYTRELLKLQELADERGITLNQDMLAALSDGSMESLGALQTLNSDAGANIDEYNAKWEETSKGKETFAKVVAETLNDFNEKSNALTARMEKLAADFDQSEVAGASAKATFDAVYAEFQKGYGPLSVLMAQYQSAIAGGFSSHPMFVSYEFETQSGNSKAAGLPYVPYDDYFAQLHEGEMVLTRLQAQAYRAEQNANYDYPTIQPTEPVSTQQAPAMTLDYGQIGSSVKSALLGVSVTIDGERVGELVADGVSRRIEESARDGRYSG